MGMTAQIHKILPEPPHCRYGLGRTVDEDLAAVADRLAISLAKGGFEIAFRLDYAEKFAAAGAGPFPPYHIWGVCHLELMNRALAAEPAVGLLLPCHLILYSNADRDTVVMVKDPSRTIDLLRHPAAMAAIMEIGDRLEDILDVL